MDIDEMERRAAEAESKDTEFEDDGSDESNGDEEDLLVDFHDSQVLLSRARTYLRFISEPALMKTVSKQIREIGAKLADELDGFLDEVSTKYEDT